MSLKPKLTILEQTTDTIGQGYGYEKGWTFSKDETPSDKVIPFNKLYPDNESSPYFVTIISLLDESIEKFDEALEAIRDNDLIASDNAVLHVLSILPELFCCRSIGEGFAALINAAFHGIKNNGDDKVLTEDQLIVLKSVFVRLSNEPFMDFNNALELVMKIEDLGLITEPKHFKLIADIIDE